MLLFFFAIQFFLAIYQVIKLHNLTKANRKTREKKLSILRKNERLLHTAYLSVENFTKSRSLPPSLSNLPLAEKEGIVLDVKIFHFPLFTPPYNASIGISEGRHYLFFRYDFPLFGHGFPFSISNIGSVQLDQDLNPLEKTFCKIRTNSPFSEDPRFFQHGKENYLIYSDIHSHSKDVRGLRIGALNLKEQKLDYITPLHHQFQKVEKNWTPFSHSGKIHFVYEIGRQKILSLSDPQKDSLESFPSLLFSSSSWSSRWGILRGGTPALLVEKEYLSFFHSSFEDHLGIIWYVMGAFTFEAFPPFKMTRISPYPILFKGIYDTLHQPMANPKVRSIYPAGFVLKDERDSLLVSCGENDSGIKLVTLSKDKLLASLQPADTMCNRPLYAEHDSRIGCWAAFGE
ncbi:MAG: hypothetical protein A3D96_05475 [Chlamydiae bacterium RIFCSPHIGHO2_12_FULL_44_59]|nr:MAG: hypothetical protein A2796_02865 [Chlamydiae bacterium RIFCSPHIGHO2_01_FULL_44_39]OGN59071.1 MAG: hypothetical protein A3C42_01245 [Chlamydiae bacterium RIFCSPHIGHO2_02_FULL_45_9]OGN60263.1 MAG: hypothetical protein A3D96_05475 [Chlamydiae bacterium RIFCSPHIGHO2_12_FULL_44_59]OGN67084.1 MAG: hypothetical protein A2978_00570 [Chlamydiae bacterium RIFCSPLOWO2_01_FULL_44_52]OGN67674.1 MAG: hypothetical protein A3I67_04505 [Chlamydiae bacterium RIFCSPLOWO2_02_FULL_45_22]OGN71377.1 MAG: hyp